MAPIKPHWVQPSHPGIQQVIVNEAEFTTKSISKIALPPFGLFAKLEFPPCTVAHEPTYATVQMGRDRHINLNSDLLYINHSCEPSLIFDTANMNVIAGPRGLQPGDELTFFYPSTEWEMAQPFDCLCGTATCRGRISGARDMAPRQLDGLWLNGHIRELLEERDEAKQAADPSNAAAAAAPPPEPNQTSLARPSEDGRENGPALASVRQTAQALNDVLAQAEKVVEAARLALASCVDALRLTGVGVGSSGKANGGASAHALVFDAATPAAVAEAPAGAQRRGPTSRELSGEMGGDTSVRV